MAAVLTAFEMLTIGNEFAQYASENKHITDAFIRERAKAAPNLAQVAADIEGTIDAVLLALYNQAAPTILP